MTQIHLFPGQGSQKKGMGAGLFELFPAEVRAADHELGYSLAELCLEDPEGKLNQTEFTQPALYAVNALSRLKHINDTGIRPDFVAGHSLGEYNALLAAGAFDFLTGLRLVRRRGALMSQVRGGGMAAVVGLPVDAIRAVLAAPAFAGVDVANFNSPLQVVVSGPADQVAAAAPEFEKAGARIVVPLKVSAAFHSRHMSEASGMFAEFLAGFSFNPLQIPVIANVTARPCEPGRVAQNLARQINSPVLWTDSIRFLLTQPDPQFTEIGPGQVLTGLLRQIKTAPAR
jgi:malonyl CoA-acyl carrier protein transacylase